MLQSKIPPTPVGTDLSGKTIIVTGGNTGLGLEAARQYLILHARRVILAVRSLSKGQDAVAALKADQKVKSSNPDAIIEVFELDLDDYESGLSFANKVKKEVDELDILLCNAGMNVMNYQKSASGHERVMQVNCYTHALVILELLPLLQATAATRGVPSRLTFVGSAAQTAHSLTKKLIAPSSSVLDHLDDEKIYRSLVRYSDSKLVVNAYVRHLATLISPSEVMVNNLCPGFVSTGLNDYLPFWLKPVVFVFGKIVSRDVEEGARTLVYASAVADSATHGKFLQNNEIAVGAPFLDEDAGKEFINKLWVETVADVSKVDSNLGVFA